MTGCSEGGRPVVSSFVKNCVCEAKCDGIFFRPEDQANERGGESMTKSEFVEALKGQTGDAAVFGTEVNLEHPCGNKPPSVRCKIVGVV